MKNLLSDIKTLFVIRYIIIGVLEVLISVLFLFEQLISSVFVCFAMLLVVISMLVSFFTSQNNYDEMAHENHIKAKAVSSDILHSILNIAITAVLFISLDKGFLNIDWSKFLPSFMYLLVGIHNLVTGIAFLKLENS